MVGVVEQFVTILAYFFLTWSYGFAVLDMCKVKEKHPAYHIIAELAVGLAVFSFLGVVLNLFRIPLHINTYLILAAIYPVVALIQSFRKGEQKKKSKNLFFTKETAIVGILLVIMLGFFMVFHKGAFIYPYLENDDPWNHAKGTLYVATEHTYDVDPDVRALNSGWAFYLEPYPPTFDVLLGVLRQLNSSILWTLKFFNVLLITMGLAFSFMFFKTYLKSDDQAIAATFILAALPSFMSHFIWSQTLALVLLPVALYTFLKALEDKKWWPVAIIAIASSMVTQPVVSFFIGIIIMLMVLFIFLHELQGKGKHRFKKTIHGLIIGAAGLAASFLYWGAQIWKWSFAGIFGTKGGELSGGWASGYTLQEYSLRDIIIAPSNSRIDQAIGIGLVTTIFLILGIILLFVLWQKTLNPKKEWRYLHLLTWFVIMAYLVFAPTLGLQGWGSSRMWAQLAFPLVLIATEGIFIIVNGITKQQKTRWILVAVVLVLVGMTSIPAKAAVQTAQWPPGAHWTAPGIEVPSYIQLGNTLPPGTRVFSVCGGDARVIGFDMIAEPWNLDQAIFRQTLVNATGEQFLSFLQRHSYTHITMDATCARKFGENETIALAERLSNTGRLRQILSQNGFLLAEVV